MPALSVPPPNLVVVPSNTSNLEMLQRPLEFAQYTSFTFGARCRDMGVRPSMGSVGNADDNAMAESFFASLECEWLNRRHFKTQAQARLAVLTWIEAWYNPRTLRFQREALTCPRKRGNSKLQSG